MKPMTPITKLYWIRVVLGIISGAASAVVAFLLHNPNDITTFVNAFTIALIVYLITYYILKAQFKDKIEKQSKILSTAIMMYFFSWLAFFVLFYTALLTI
jgi:ABC-type Fe3+-siderophore transport system permease subunit